MHYEKFASGTIKCIADEIPYELPEGWEWARLGSIADTNLGKMLDAEKNKGVPRPYLRNINVRWGSFDLSDLLEMRIQDEEVERYSVRKGDLIVCEGGEPGRCAIWEDDDIVFFQKALHRIRPYLVLSEYLFIVISALSLSGLTEQYFTGTTIKHLTGQSLKALLIPIPTIHEQQDICKIVNKALMLVDCIESNRKELITVISSTKAYILDLAIRGQLVQQDPTDEPATVLLARIRKERENLIKQGNTKREGRDSVIYRGEDNSYYEKIGNTTENIDDEIPFEIPGNWHWCRIRDICTMAAGKSKPTEAIHEIPFMGSYPCFGGNGIRGYVDEYSHAGKHSIIGRQGALCGNVNVADGRFYATEHAVVTTLFSEIDFTWNNYILTALKLNQYATGAAQPGLSVANIMNVFIPLPPYNEQIVLGKRIDQLFGLLKLIEKSLS